MEISVFVRSTLAIVSLVATAACTGSSPMSPSAAPTASLSSASVATDAQGGALQGRGGLAPFGLPAGLGFPAVQGGRNVTLVGDIAGTNFEPAVCHPCTDLTLGFPTSCLLFGEGPWQFTREAPGGVAFTTCHCSVAGVGSEATTQVTLKIAYPPATNGHGIPPMAGVPRPSLMATAEDEHLLVLVQKVQQMVHAYRLRGHLWADLDPLGLMEKPRSELTIENFDISERDLNTVVPTGDIAGLGEQATVRQIISLLEETYCHAIGVEYMHIEDPTVRTWLRERMEATGNRLTLSTQEQLMILEKLLDAEIFEQFLHTNFIGAKRF